ncbi:MAG: thiamine-phosphate kinase [Gammaproteobacteria bacterium]|nr:thiamine-phosphate kinase [Gammaproteobacteria bacterium]
MPLSEFSIIDRFFRRQSTPKTLLSIGDDAALIEPPVGEVLAISVDTLVVGRHFPEQTTPADIGYKSLAVNLSDMAAMGAEPRWATLSLALPEVDEAFLQPFSDTLIALAEQHGVELVGGDTVRGPLTITLQIIGTLPAERALKRSGARVGDAIFISGTVGDAAQGLSFALAGHGQTDDEAYLLGRLNRPTPRVELGLALRGLATSAIDISDGLLADLGHILKQSGVSAEIFSELIPCSDALRAAVPELRERLPLMVAGGDDYELCFTVPESGVEELAKIAGVLSLPLTRIGTICEAGDSHSVLLDGKVLSQQGFDHFKGED